MRSFDVVIIGAGFSGLAVWEVAGERRKFAEKIFFRRSSFPDVDILKGNPEIGFKKLTTDLHR